MTSHQNAPQEAGTNRCDRVSSDFDSVHHFNNVDSDIDHAAIRDCRRFGKFTPGNSGPRLLVVTLTRTKNVISLLSRRGSFVSPHVIKPFLSKKERNDEKLLLNERWKLLQSGVPKQNICLNKSTLFVNGEAYAQVSDSRLTLFHNTSHTSDSDSHEPDHESGSNLVSADNDHPPSPGSLASPEGRAEDSA